MEAALTATQTNAPLVETLVESLVVTLADRSAELRRLAEPELPLNTMLARADEKVKGGPGGSVRAPAHAHPRNVRILPNSRDFH